MAWSIILIFIKALMETTPGTRERIIRTADALFYQQGYDYTSFADIASATGLSRGNFYHHFKSKDEILTAVIALRRDQTLAMLQLWSEQNQQAHARIGSFINLLQMNRATIASHGCPVGSLCSELGKLGHPALAHANQLFAIFRDWLSQEFCQLGLAAQAPQLAMHLLARSQGIATLAQAFHDQAFIDEEVAQLHRWLDDVVPKPETTP